MEDLGLMYLGNCKIYINRKQARSQQWSTLVHEVIEAINALTELNLEHSQIATLESALYQVLAANKSLKI